MFENALDRVPSRGATIGIESYSGTLAFNNARARQNRATLISADCGEAAFARLLGEAIPTFSMDLRGQVMRGTRVVPDGSFTIADYNGDFNAVRDSLGVERIVLHGYSVHGFYAAHYAIAHPERLQALILTEPSIFEERAALEQWARLAEENEILASTKAMLQYVNPLLSGEELERGADFVNRCWQSPEIIGKHYLTRAENQLTAEALSNLKVPLLLIGGTESAMKHNVYKAAAAVPDAHVWWIRGANHFDLVANPDYAPQVAATIRNFLSSQTDITL
jgi:pimeloyl-ACP methyl ester carboxylesterase